MAKMFKKLKKLRTRFAKKREQRGEFSLFCYIYFL